MIAHDGGFASVHLRDLSPDLQRQFNYSPEADLAAETTEGDPDSAGGGPAVAAPAGDAPREADVAAMLRAALRKLSRA